MRMVCPSWFFLNYLLEHSDGIVTRYEVRKKFYIDMEKVKEKYLSSFAEDADPVEVRKSWKRAYVCLFGLTCRRSQVKSYKLVGETSYEFIQYLQSTVSDPNVTFREYNVNDERQYIVTIDKPEIVVCPQVLNARTLYSLSRSLDIALCQPLSSIAMITLDSIGLTERIYEPLYKMKLKIHENNTKLTSLLDYPPPMDFSFLLTPHIPRHTVNKENFVVGMGGSGKTYTKVHAFNPERTYIACPTNQFRETCEKDYPFIPASHIVTHHVAGKLGVTSEAKASVAKEGVYIFDEFTFRTEAELSQFKERHPQSIFFFCGDICPVSGRPFQCYNEYQKTPYTLVNVEVELNDRRSSNEETKELKRGMRKIMTDAFTHPNYHKYLYVDRLISYIEKFIPYKDRIAEQPIIISSNWARSFYKEDDMDTLPTTCHKIQGATLEMPFQIDLSTMSLQQIYTAISRCRDIKNITLIKKADLQSDDARASYRLDHMDFVSELEEGGCLYEEQ
jgi:hypothetical protein